GIRDFHVTGVQTCALPILAPFEIIRSVDEIEKGIEKLDYPCVLKTSRGGYDGKGQRVIRSQSDIEEARKLLANGPCVLESWLERSEERRVGKECRWRWGRR